MSNYEPKVGETAVTRDGRKAHVLAIRTDLHGPNTYPVVGYIEGSEVVASWRRDGSYGSKPGFRLDLVGPWVDPCTDKFPQWGMIKIMRRNDGSFSASLQFFATHDQAAEVAKACNGSTFGPINATDSFPVAPGCG